MRREEAERKAEEAKSFKASPDRGVPTAGGSLGGGGGRSLSPSTPTTSSSTGVSRSPIHDNNDAEEEKRRAKLLSELPAEPSVDEKDVISIMVRKPNGSMSSRRFLKTWSVGTLFDFVNAQSSSSSSSSYRLVTRFPRRVYTAEEVAGGKTFVEMGLTGKQETLMFEPC